VVFLKTKEMKRTTIEPGQSRWKKTGGGSLHLTIGGSKRIIKPGEIFTAKEEEIPDSFRDVIKPLDTIVVPVKQVEKPVEPVKPVKPVEPVVKASALEYSVRARSGGGYYDVVDKNGKAQNEKALREDAAEALLKSLLEE